MRPSAKETDAPRVVRPVRDEVTRRGFLAGATGLAAGVLAGAAWPSGATAAPDPQHDRHADGAEAATLRVGLIGCGGRGTGAAVQALHADEGAVLWAMGDAFRDRLDRCAAALESETASIDEADGGDAWSRRLRASEERRFVGLDAYEKVIASGVDVVLLATPPVFRPSHLAAAVDAGKHVFCEKPVAVDAPGVRSVLASARRAKDRGLTLVSGFCWRYGDPERATFARIHDGAIGEIRAVYTTYNTTGFPSPHPRRDGWTDLEFQLRNWHYFHTFSGDHVVEQACHAIDWIAWAMRDRMPSRCVAVGGRQSRPDTPETGNIFDHFGITYEYEDGVRAFHMCRHFPDSHNDNSGLVIGSRGRCTLDVWRPRHVIEGETAWTYEGEHRNMYQNEHDALFASIRAGAARNDGTQMAHSTMMAVLARMAAYTGKAIDWEEGLASEESLSPATWTWGELPRPAVARPGFTRFS